LSPQPFSSFLAIHCLKEGHILCSNCKKYYNRRLLQKRVARAILDVDFTVPSETMFTELKWMTFPERVIYHKAIQMYKTCCGDAPDYLKNDFVFTSEIHSRLIRSSSNFQLHTPIPNTDLFRTLFIFSGTSIWNSIPEYLKTASSVKHFKSLYLRWYKLSFES